MSTTPNTDTPLESLGKVFVTLLVLPLSFFMRGWAISTLWNWFVAAPFNAPHLTVLMAVGVSMVVTLLTFSISKTMREVMADDRSWAINLFESLLVALVCYPVIVAVGWLVHLFY